MRWNDHSKLVGTHAFLSASKPGWLGKDAEELMEAKRNSYAQSIGTMLHAYAADCIRFREKLKKGDAKGVRFELMRKGIPEYAIDIQGVFPNLMHYVNDAIGFGLDPEVVLYPEEALGYSRECYGTADAINVCDGILRIHDLKTGTTPAKMEQLMIYAALFYLEYEQRPEHVPAALRIYQNDEIIVCEPDPMDIREVMDSILEKNRVVQDLKRGGF